jgi:hypothetical protein
LLGALDRHLGQPPPGGEARPDDDGHPTMVHVLPVTPTADVNPFSFRRSRQLIDEAAELAGSWLARSDGGDVPLLAEPVTQVEEHPA